MEGWFVVKRWCTDVPILYDRLSLSRISAPVAFGPDAAELPPAEIDECGLQHISLVNSYGTGRKLRSMLVAPPSPALDIPS